MSTNHADFKVKHGLVVNTTATFLSTVTSISTTTGGVILSGGAGIAKDVVIGGTLNVGPTGAGVLISQGDISLTSNGGSVVVTTSTNATSTTTGALQVVGGAGFQGDIYARNIYSNGQQVGLQSNTTTNLAGGVQYQIPYQSAPGVTTFVIPPPTTQNSLLQFTTGTGFTWTNTTTVGGGTFFYSPVVDTFTSNGSTTTFALSTTPVNKNILTVVVDGVTQLQTAFSLTGNNLVFSEIPYNNAVIDVHYANVLSTTTSPSAGLTGNIQYNWNGMMSGTTYLSYDSSTGVVAITGNTAATSTTTGALTVSGGVGIGGNLYVGGDIVANKLTIQLTTVTTTLVTTDDIISTYNSTPTNSTNTGALQIGGGAGIAGSVYVGGNITATTFYGSMGGSHIAGTGLTGSNYNGSANQTWTLNTATLMQVATQVVQSHSTGTGILGSAYNGSTAQTWSLDTSTLMARAVQTVQSLTAGTGLTGTAFNGSTAQTWTLNTSTVMTTAVNLAGGTAGQFAYQTGAGATSFMSTGSMYVYRATIADSASGSSAQVNTLAQTSTSNYYLTFVDSNNASATAESVYTTSSIYVSPATGNVNIGGTITSPELKMGSFVDIWPNNFGTLNIQNTNVSGLTYISSNEIALVDKNYNNMIYGLTGDRVELYYNNSVKLVTTSTGVRIPSTTDTYSSATGALIVSGGVGVAGGGYFGGTVTATTFVGNLTGTASTATSAATAYSTIGTLTAGTGLTGTAFNGSANQTWTLNTATLMQVATQVVQSHSTGTGILGGAYNGSTAQTWTLDTSTLMNKVVNLAGGNAYQIPYQTAPNTTAFANSGTTGQFWQATTNGAPTWTTTANIYVANANIATNVRAGTAGQLLYQSAVDTTGFINTATTGNFLQANYVGAPTWTSTGSMYVYRATIADSATGGAGSVTNSVTFNNSNTGDASGTTYNGSAARTISANTLGALSLASGGTVSGAVTFSGPVTFSGTATYALSTNTYYTDNILELHVPPTGVNTPWFVDDGKDIGFRFHYYTASTDTNAALVLANDTKWLEWYSSGAEGTSTFAGSAYGNFKTGGIWATTGAGVGYTSSQIGEKFGVNGGGYFNGIVTATTFVGALTGTASNATTATSAGTAYSTIGTLTAGAGLTGTAFNGSANQTWTLNTATLMATSVSAINLSAGSAMALPYQSASGTTAYLAAGTSGYILQTNGTGSAPSWVAASGLSAGSATNADNLKTIQQPVSGTYYPAFVDSNNSTAAYEAYYTTSSFTINPGTGLVSIANTLTAIANTNLTIKAPDYTNTYGDGKYLYLMAGQGSTANGVGNGGITYLYGGQGGTSSGAGGAVYIYGGSALGTGGGGAVNIASGSGSYASGAISISIPINNSGSTQPGSQLSLTSGSAASGSTNLAGGNITLTGGVGTGNAGGGKLVFNTYSPTTSGTSNGTYVGSMFEVSNTGAVAFGGTSNYGSSGQILQSNGNSSPTWVNASSLSAGSSTNADNLKTIQQTSSATYYPSFVDSNNSTAAYEAHYTTSSFYINPASGLVTIAAPAGGDGIPSLRVTQGSAPATFNWAASYMNSSLGSSKNNILLIGQAESNKNAGYIGFNHSGTAGSVTNFLTFGLHSVDNIMNITGNGYVGIGNTAPAFKLAVNTASDVWHAQFGTSGGKQLRIGGSTTYGSVIGAYNTDDNSSPASLLLQRDGGNVGIGLSNPAYKLDIAGTNSAIALSFGSTVPNNPLFINTYGGWSGIGMDSSTAGLRLAGDYSSGSNPLVDIGYYDTASVSHANWVSRLKIANNGAVLFNGSYGTSGQVLQSNGNAAPTWVNQSSIAAGSAPLTSTYVGYGSASNLLTGSANFTWDGTVLSVLGASSNGYIKFAQAVGTKLRFYDASTDKYGVDVQSSELRIYSGAQGASTGGITFGKYDGTTFTENMRIRNDGNVAIGTTTTSYKLEVNGSFAATTKSFVIDHPTKPGMRLRYGSLEGPENGVYVRGKLKGSDIIELPEYWTKLVDPESITVQLTPIGKHQKLYVKEIKDNCIYIANDGLFAGEINCFYYVLGERIDVEKLVVELNNV